MLSPLGNPAPLAPPPLAQLEFDAAGDAAQASVGDFDGIAEVSLFGGGDMEALEAVEVKEAMEKWAAAAAAAAGKRKGGILGAWWDGWVAIEGCWG